MCDIIRKIVSGHSRRYIEGKYNLDLSYITDRIIAMSYPASGFESAYRNHIDTHPSLYRVYNICGRDYKSNKFGQAYELYKDWKDHFAPPLTLLIIVVDSMYQFLCANEKNIVAIHCNAGKGRTGVAIASLLMYCHYIQGSDASLQFYSYQRFGLLKGVSHPCQMRYVQYFEQINQGKVRFPVPKILKKIVISTLPKFSKDGIRPFVTIEQFNNNGKDSGLLKIYTSKLDHKKQAKYLFADAENDKYMTMKICPDVSIVLIGDITMYLYHNVIGLYAGGHSTPLLLTIRSDFLISVLTLGVEDVDPDRIRASKKFNQDNFKIQVFFEDYCTLCSPTYMCDKCQEKFPNEFKTWCAINKLLDVSSFKQAHNSIVHGKCSIAGSQLCFQKYMNDILDKKCEVGERNFSDKECCDAQNEEEKVK